jgi:cholesterol oxidase
MTGGPDTTRRDFLAGTLAAAAAVAAPGCATPRGGRGAPGRRATGPCLSSRADEIPPDERFTVVVVGSGYGGAVSALRLAQALGTSGSVCLLERGREAQPGEYPDDEAGVMREFQVHGWEPGCGELDLNPTGLFDARVFAPTLNVVKGCGLGGGSLINAGVALVPDHDVLDDVHAWPLGFRQDLAGFHAGVARAQAMLQPAELPCIPLAKLDAHARVAAALGGTHRKVPINVRFEDGANAAGVHQRACQLCGDCISGCNFASKSTLVMNYLPAARAAGARLYTHAAVSRLSREGCSWRVRYRITDAGPDAPERSLRADTVVLAAGVLGTTEILLRSRKHGLRLSEQLGRRFSANGDVIACAWNTDPPINALGYGWRDPDRMRACIGPVGPTITSVIEARDLAGRRVRIEEGALPGAVAWVVQALAGVLAAKGVDTDPGLKDALRERARQLHSLFGGPHSGANRHTHVFLGMYRDDAQGRLSLGDDGRLALDWGTLVESDALEGLQERLRAGSAALGGHHVKDPLRIPRLGEQITVHPLGGCVMADDAATGVCDHRGRVFSDHAGTQVHPGLHVADASLIPRALLTNPLLTISALAERSSTLLAQEPLANLCV